MPVKAAILALLSPEALREVCAALAVESGGQEMTGPDLQGRESMGAEQLLPFLSLAELRQVCEACGVAAGGPKATLAKRLLKLDRGPTFAAIDFETADYYPDSACAVGIARVENHCIVERAYHLIRPPRRRFAFTHIHGITWQDVAQQPTFGELWPDLAPILAEVDFLAAHNAPFDRSVLQACCAAAGLAPPNLPFRCTVKLARQTWNLYPTKLHHVCDHLGITLKHHFAASDAEACALIVIAAHRGVGGEKQGK